MTSQLQQAIELANSLSFAEQLELLKTLSAIIQSTHSRETKTATTESDTDFSAASFRKSWRQAITGETLPLSQMWEGIDVE
jgi:hypothetical protein